jgi:HEAT repeat protein
MNELNKAIEAINIESLNEEDKQDLLRIFMVTKNHGVRNKIAMVFADLQYQEAVPYIVKKINDPDLFNYVGTLVYSIGYLNCGKYFLTFIRVLSEHEYEARIEAYDIVEKYAGAVSKPTRTAALKALKDFQAKEELADVEKYENSKLHFIDAAIKLLLTVN